MSSTCVNFSLYKHTQNILTHRDNSAGITTCYGRPGRYGNRKRIQARFSEPVQMAPGAHPFTYAMGTVFSWGKAVGDWR